MCLAVPGKVLSRHDEDGLTMGEVDFSGIKKTVCLSFTPDVQIGQYVIVHVGFAISILDEKQAQQTIALFRENAVQ